MPKCLGKCPKCQGTVYEEDGGRKCLACGWTNSTRTETERYYNLNAPQILATYRLRGVKGVIENWLIPEGSIRKLVQRFGALYPEDKKPLSVAAPVKGPTIIFTITDRDVELLESSDQDRLWAVLGDISVARIKQVIKEVGV